MFIDCVIKLSLMTTFDKEKSQFNIV